MRVPTPGAAALEVAWFIIRREGANYLIKSSYYMIFVYSISLVTKSATLAISNPPGDPSRFYDCSISDSGRRFAVQTSGQATFMFRFSGE